MICPNCGSEDDKVERSIDVGRTIWRDRVCRQCSHSWSTAEQEDEPVGLSVKTLVSRRKVNAAR